MRIYNSFNHCLKLWSDGLLSTLDAYFYKPFETNGEGSTVQAMLLLGFMLSILTTSCAIFDHNSGVSGIGILYVFLSTTFFLPVSGLIIILSYYTLTLFLMLFEFSLQKLFRKTPDYTTIDIGKVLKKGEVKDIR